MKPILHTTTIIAGLIAGLSAHAASFGLNDPRAMGMGGVGVSTATSSNASFFNPAALAAARKDDNFGLTLPAISARAYDPDNLRDDMDNVEKTGDTLTDSIKAFNTSVNTVNTAINNTTLTTAQVNDLASKSSSLATSLRRFDSALSKINQKKVELGAFAGTSVAIPGQTLGVGIYVAGRADLGAHFNYNATDATTLSGHATTADNINAAATSCSATPATCTNVANTIDASGDTNIDNLQSTFVVRGAAVQEAGISFASRIDALGKLDVGITPKYVKVQTFDYAILAQSTDVDTKKGRKDFNHLNFDLGFSQSLGEDYKVGMVIKNVLPQEYTTVLGNKIKTSAQARMGMSHHTSWSTLGLDVDLTRNKGTTGGFDKDTQFVGVGAEMDAWLLQLRAGYRHDLAGNYGGIPSVGVGLNLFGLHIDAAVARSSKELTASAQLGLNF